MQDQPKLLIFESVRFITLQLLISSLQLLSTAQAVGVWVSNTVYTVYFMRSIYGSKLMQVEENGVLSRTKVRLVPVLLFKLKFLFQELCIFFIVRIILVFAFC